jgi:hypothetical protein
MKTKKDINITLRLESRQLDRIAHTLGVDRSKAIRASLNLCDNVIHGLFGGEITHIFKRKRSDEEQPRYKI